MREVYREESVLEDLFESIVGAMWFDNNLDIDAIYDYVVRLLDLRMDKEEYYQKNAFVQLKEFVDKNHDIDFYKKDGIYTLLYEGQVRDAEPIGLFIRPNYGRYQTMIAAANYFISILKKDGIWPTIIIDTKDVTPANAINRLQELYLQGFIDLNPSYVSANDIDRTTNLWHVDCVYKLIIHGADARDKKEAKKLAAYDMFIDLADRINNK